MALESEQSFVVYNGTGFAAVGYPVPFTYKDPAHLQVSVLIVGATAPTVLAAADFYVVDDPAAIFTRAAVATTSKVTVERVVPYTQPTSYPEGGRFLAQTHEETVDFTVMQTQQLSRLVGQCIRLPLTSDAPDVLKPTPGALLGFDDAGNFAHINSARVRELAQLEGGVETNPLATFADAAARAARVPDLTGQVGVQRDDSSLWISTGLTAGDWVPSKTPYAFVSDEAQLLAALPNARHILVTEPITLSAPLILSGCDDLILQGGGEGAALILPHNGTTQQTVCWVKSNRVTLRNLKFTANHPLTSGRAFEDIGLRLPVVAGETCHGLTVEGCRFENLGWGILRDGSSASEAINDVRITRCTFEGIFQGAIYVRWFCHNLRIIDNIFRQRTLTQTHDIEYNAIYIANRCDGIVVAFNNISRFGRHGIEIWNDSDDVLAAASNKNTLVAYNDVTEPLQWSTYTPIGITILGKGAARYFGNLVEDCAIGLEIGGDNVNNAYHHAAFNTVRRSKNQGLSINGVSHALVEVNIIDRVAIDGVTWIGAVPIGAQIINGGRNIRLRHNTFIDAGRYNVGVLGKALTITGITQATNAVFTVSGTIGDTARPNGWFVGKRICLRGIGGMTGLNDKYYTITEVSGSTFKVGVDTSGFPAYTAGGRVQEDWVGLTICDNDFYVYDDTVFPSVGVGPSFPAARAIYIYDVQNAVAKRNQRWALNTLNGYWGTFSISNYGTVYHDDAGGSVNTTAADLAFSGSNQSIPVFP